MLVILDAGHGKDTAGKRSFDSSFFEYEFNRDIAKRVKAILMEHNVEVILTATFETDISLTDRCKIANNADADISVSIHANAFGEDWNSANGWEIYFCKGSAKGEKLAKCIHDESIALGLSDRGVKANTDFTVLKRTNAPAVLIEHFFYTNKLELAKCNTEEFRQQFAIADSKGILNYLGVEWHGDKKTPKTDYKKLYEVEKAKVDEITKIINS